MFTHAPIQLSVRCATVMSCANIGVTFLFVLKENILFTGNGSLTWYCLHKTSRKFF